MSPASESPYGARRIGRGAKHFLIGKGVTSLSGICTLFFVVRGLDLPQFAAYSILFGLVELCIAITNVGTGQILSRFVPEVYARGHVHVLRRMIFILLSTRYIVLYVSLLLLYMSIPVVSGWIGLQDWQNAFRLYLLIVFFRSITNTVFQVLEAMLYQGSAQGAMGVMTACRCLLVGFAYFAGWLDLTSLIFIELATDIAGATVLLLLLERYSRPSTPRPSREERRWLKENRQRMLSFGLKGYAQHLIIMPFSGVVNRLVMGGGVPGPQMALFGFAQSIFDLMQRFLPAQLFMGLIRPVMAARYSQNGQFSEVALLTNLSLKVNLLLIGLAFVAVAAGGADMLLDLTAGKYGEPAVSLLMLMFVLVAFESWRHVIDIMGHTVERYGIFVFANGLLGSSLLLGILLLPHLGVYSLPLANVVGIGVGCPLVLWWLRRTGFVFRHDFGGILRILFSVAVATGCAWVLQPRMDSWPARLVLCGLLYASVCALLLVPRGAERDLLATVVPFFNRRGLKSR